MVNDQNNIKEKADRGHAQRAVDVIIYFLEKVAILVRDFGMPVIMFGMGLYVFGIVLTADQNLSPYYKVGIGLFLTAGGLLSQLWLHARQNPRSASPKTRDEDVRMEHENALERQLERITKLLAQTMIRKREDYRKKE